VIDLDTQGNASYTLADHASGVLASELFGGSPVRERMAGLASRLVLIGADSSLANLERMDLAVAANALRASMAVLNEFLDVCLIDTPPSLGIAMAAAVLSADYMLSPVEMEAYSLQGMKKMVAIVGNLRKQNPKLRFLGMVPNKVDARKPRHVRNLATLKEAYPQLVFPCAVGARDSIAEALGKRLPVWKIRKTAARQATREVRELADCVLKKMEIAASNQR
jgi:chromosome partitioning protein